MPSPQLTPDQGFLTTENGAVTIDNAISKFRDGFMGGIIDPTIWDTQWTNQADSFISFGGNSSGAKYLRVSMSPYQKGSEFILRSKQSWKMPHRFGFGFSASQRIIGQEAEAMMVGCNTDGSIPKITPPADMPISGDIVVASSVATINFPSNHPYNGGDRVILKNNGDVRINIGPIFVTVVNRTTITVPCGLTSATYTGGGTVQFVEYADKAENAGGYSWENATVSNASVVSRRNAGKYYSVNTSHSSTTATQANTSPYTDAFRSAGDFELINTFEHVKTASRTASSTSATTGYSKYTETCLEEAIEYKMQFRCKNLDNYSALLPCYIVSATKTGTTTATVTTNVPHGLTTGRYMQAFGARDQVNFPNMTSVTSVLSVPTTTTFTIAWGTASTTSTEGGIITEYNGGVAFPGIMGFSIQSFTVANNVLTTTLNTTASGFIPGEVYEVVMSGGGASYNGPYLCVRQYLTTVEFMKVDYSAITPIGTTNCGGGIVRRTDYRIHYVREMEYTRLAVELSNNRGAIDGGEGISILSAGGTLSTVSAVTTVGTISALNGYQSHQLSIASERNAWYNGPGSRVS